MGTVWDWYNLPTWILSQVDVNNIFVAPRCYETELLVEFEGHVEPLSLVCKQQCIKAQAHWLEVLHYLSCWVASAGLQPGPQSRQQNKTKQNKAILQTKHYLTLLQPSSDHEFAFYLYRFTYSGYFR